MKTIRRTSYLAYDKTIVPFIRLSGRWLDELGFKVGTKFHIEKEENKITLIPADSSPISNSLNSNKT